MNTQLLKNRKLNYRKYLAGISIPPAEFIAWQDKSGNNNYLLAKSKKRQPIYHSV
jgi:hypothetical protein